jgi:hypothetical protein
MEQRHDFFYSDWDLSEVIRNIQINREDDFSQMIHSLQKGNIDDTVDWLRIETSRYPWVMLVAAYVSLLKNSPEEAGRWLRAATLISADTILQLWAWHNLRILGKHPAPELSKKILGIVIEVPYQEGADILASYSDGTARYLNHTGGMIFWDDYNEEITPLIYGGLKMAPLVGEPADEHRTTPIQEGDVRLTLLTPGGMYIWEGKPEDGSAIAKLFANQAVLLRGLVQQTLNRKDAEDAPRSNIMS